ncbi:diaminopropionate ammonia-lyase [Deinococcus apachensis]|uniref:diaminopropionate ammonia-lyase n=1 Tax=Deinococcus apachensis TaxID=309886 RepID=UPI00036CFEC0|nr:diaminopropionate ammonia-lyase [Deinococcus apachensis]
MTITPELPRTYFNPAVRTFEPQPEPGLLDFHRKLPGYAPTPLVRAPHLAAALGVREAWVKDESSRLGLPAYKILGASWATYRELESVFGPFQPWATLDELAAQLRPHGLLTLIAATDGNHGRAVARVARWLGLSAHILVPDDMAPARIQALREEGARVDVVHGSYDDAVRASARLAGPRQLVISDTSWDGYSRVPGWVIAGYGTIFREIDEQLAGMNAGPPDLVAVQMGVGSLAAAVIHHYRGPGRKTEVVGVEPTRADCVLRSLEAGELTEAPGPHGSIMAGLNCGNTSPLAWPLLRGGLSASVAVPDMRAEEAMRLLARDGVTSGESGAAGAAGLLELLTGAGAEEARGRLGITRGSWMLMISTEGATDPGGYARILRGEGAHGESPRSGEAQGRPPRGPQFRSVP